MQNPEPRGVRRLLRDAGVVLIVLMGLVVLALALAVGFMVGGRFIG